jgi:3,4-dihydroxy 2-butanone 4-phosphate synthase / GTP cyclohydrolase II
MTAATAFEHMSSHAEREHLSRARSASRRRFPGAAASSAASRQRIAVAVDQIASGRPIVLLDTTTSEDHSAYLVAAAKFVTPDLVAFLVRHSSGLLCAPMAAEICDRLELPAMVRMNENQHRAPFTVSFDARARIGTGISATDRSHTIALLADPATTGDDLSRPGHILGLRAHPEGVLGRARYTEAAVDLAGLAGLPPVGVMGTIVNDDGSTITRAEVTRFAALHDLPMLTIGDLVAHRHNERRQLRLGSRSA